MGSTNRPDSLDPALVRPGRFDRKIAVEPPDRTGRRAIVEYYLGRIAHDDSIDVDAIVGDTAGYTPASLMTAITKDAVRMAIFDGRDQVNQRDVDLAFQEQAMGLENPIEEMEEDQREQVAYHEAGHAIAVYYVMPQRRIVRTTIIRRSNALGYVLSADKFELYSQPLNFYVRSIMVSLAGDVATKVRYKEPWTGTSGDYNSVQNYLWALAAQGFFGPPIGPDPRVEFKDEMTRFWLEAEAKTRKLIEDHWVEVDRIAQELLIHGDMSGKDVIRIIKEASASNGHRPEEAESLEELMEVVEAEAAD
jgi:cell division protease FtsH